MSKMNVISKADAVAAGLNKYYTGEPCKHGHLEERYVSGDRCLECARRVTKKFKSSDKSKAYDKQWKNMFKYKLTKQEFLELVEQHQGKCAICSTEFGEDRATMMCIDHCHTTGKVRGLLCSRCNVMLGFARDDVSILSKGIEYLNQNNLGQL